MPVPVSERLIAEEMPVIDLSSLRSADKQERKRLANEIADSCSNLGFFYIKNHGVPQSAIDEMFAAAHEFCSLPLDQKMKLSMVDHENFLGYLPMLYMGNDPDIKGNRYESFFIQKQFSPDDPDVLAGKRLHAMNRWPEEMPGLRTAMLSYYEKTEALTFDLLNVFAIGLDLPEDTFSRHFKKPMSRLRLMHYPPQDPMDPSEQMGVRPHTDPGLVTLLSQDQIGGLEVLMPGGEWYAVPPIPGTYVVNLGEMMKIMTDGVFAATPHRVINRYGADRYSIPFFVDPDFDTVITPLMKNPDRTPRVEPWFATSESKDKPVTSGEILLRLFSRVFPSTAAVRTDVAPAGY